MASIGIPALDALIGGLPRGCLTEICGPASSGRTTVLLAVLAAATRRGEYCAVIDASDSLDPQSVAAAGVELDRLLWVRCGDDSPRKENSPQSHPSTSLRAGSGTERKENQKQGCPISRVLFAREVGISSQTAFEFDRTKSRASEHRLEQVLRATDLLLESGGFGLIILDLADLPPQSARRIPLTTWFRFRRAVEYKPTILLAVEQLPIAGSCSSLLLRLNTQNHPKNAMAWKPSHAHLLSALHINAELIRSRLERKPSCSVMFATKTAWAG
jgi:recombination protein RecA